MVVLIIVCTHSLRSSIYAMHVLNTPSTKQIFFFFFYIQIVSPWPSFDNALLTTYINLAYLALALLVTSINCHRPPCLEESWWDETTDSCIPCTICDEQSIVLRPCQPHKDVICGTLNDLEYDWNGIIEQDQTIKSDSWSEVGSNIAN